MLIEGRKIYTVARDGNCFFRCLSHQLYGSAEQHATIRSLLVTFVSMNKDTFAQLKIPADSSDIETHISKMILTGTWGTHIELFATFTCFQIPVYYLQMQPGTTNFKWHICRPIGPSCNLEQDSS